MICFVCKTSNDLQRRGKALRLRIVPSINQNTAPFRKSVGMGVIGGSSLTPASASTPSSRSGLPGGVHIGGVEDPTSFEQHIAHGRLGAFRSHP